MIQMGTHSASLGVHNSCADNHPDSSRQGLETGFCPDPFSGKNTSKQRDWCCTQVWICPISPIKSLQKQWFSTSHTWTHKRISSWKPLTTANPSTQGPAICVAAAFCTDLLSFCPDCTLWAGDSCFVQGLEEGSFTAWLLPTHRCYRLGHGKVLKAFRNVAKH